MRLNMKRTAWIGLVFLSISAFWGLYDFAVPLILKNTYGLEETLTGAVMAMDNVAALFLLPLFGTLSDRRGRRMPFILWGATAAGVLLLALPVVVRQGMMAPQRGTGLPVFLVLLALLLVAMGTYRSPAVALMPDVTPRPLRSKGNALINLMGSIGHAMMLVLVNLLVFDTVDGAGAPASDYTWLFVTVAVLLPACAWAVKRTTPEERLRAEAEAINARLAETEERHPDAPQRRLSAGEMRSLALLLISVALWFMAYNAVTTAFSRYAQEVWRVREDDAANCLLTATAAAILSYWPVGLLASRFGRKRMILAGLALMLLGFLGGALEQGRMAITVTTQEEMLADGVLTMVETTHTYLSPAAYLLFALVGMGWACIGVNSYPMVVELASGADVGRYTGFYYTFSMAAQVLTPILSGALLEHRGYRTLFPYALAMAGAAFLTMLLVRHGDSKPEAKSGLEALDVED